MKEELKNEIPEEPTADEPDVVRIVLKLPHGSRIERKFLKNQSLKVRSRMHWISGNESYVIVYKGIVEEIIRMITFLSLWKLGKIIYYFIWLLQLNIFVHDTKGRQFKQTHSIGWCLQQMALCHFIDYFSRTNVVLKEIIWNHLSYSFNSQLSSNCYFLQSSFHWMQ